jgi:hypothetical protein
LVQRRRRALARYDRLFDQEARMLRRNFPAVLALALACGTASGATRPPDLSGNWKLNRQATPDPEPIVQDAAGSEYVQGRPGWSTETWLPWGRSFSEDERVTLREVLLGMLPHLDTLEVEQTPAEFKTVWGDEGVRIFHFDRPGASASLVTGETVKRRAEWKGGTLLLETSGGKNKVKETLALTAGGQLVHTLHVDMDLLKHAFDLRLVYDRAQ